MTPRAHIEAWRANWTRPQWHSGSARVRQQLQFLQSEHDGDLDIVSRSQDGSRWLVSYTLEPSLARVLSLRAGGQRLVHLATQIPAINQLTLPKLRPVVIRSRDGLELVSYLLLPLGSDPRSAMEFRIRRCP